MRWDKSTTRRPILLFSPGHQTVRQQIRDSHSMGLTPPGSPYQTKFRGTVSPRASKRQSNITQLRKNFSLPHTRPDNVLSSLHAASQPGRPVTCSPSRYRGAHVTQTHAAPTSTPVSKFNPNPGYSGWKSKRRSCVAPSVRHSLHMVGISTCKINAWSEDGIWALRLYL